MGAGKGQARECHHTYRLGLQKFYQIGNFYQIHLEVLQVKTAISEMVEHVLLYIDIVGAAPTKKKRESVQLETIHQSQKIDPEKHHRLKRSTKF